MNTNIDSGQDSNPQTQVEYQLSIKNAPSKLFSPFQFSVNVMYYYLEWSHRYFLNQFCKIENSHVSKAQSTQFFTVILPVKSVFMNKERSRLALVSHEILAFMINLIPVTNATTLMQSSRRQQCYYASEPKKGKNVTMVQCFIL